MYAILPSRTFWAASFTLWMRRARKSSMLHTMRGGKQTETLNTIGLHCGCMGHEMLNEFNLINMNGRVYVPVLGRFLSPDKYVQEGDNSQNYNSYSYCLNNPLKYADPSGDVFVLDDFIAITAMGTMNAAMSDKPIWKGALLVLPLLME